MDLEGSGPDEAAPPRRNRRWVRALAWCSVGLVALLVIGPLVVPVPTLPDTVEPAALASSDSHFVDLGDVTIHYVMAGSDEAPLPIVLLHGFGASTFSWRQQLPLLADRGLTVAFDRPAFGLTSRPMPGEWRGPSPYSTSQNAEQTIALMDRLGIEKALLIGHSAGAAVAVQVAAEHPERVAGLVLEAPALATSRDTPAFVSRLMRTPQGRRIGPLFVRRIAGPQSDEFVRGAYHESNDVTAGVVAGYRLPLRARNWDRALWEFTAAPRVDAEVALQRVKAPTLVIAGANDEFVPFEESRRVARLLDGSSFAEFESTGHIPHEEQPERFANEVYRFLDTLPESSCGT